MKKHNVLIVAAFAFLALLLFVFSDFVFDSSKFMVNNDAFVGLGSYYARTESVIVPEWDNSKLGGLPTLEAIHGSLYHPLALLRFIMDPGRAEGWIFILIIWSAFVSAFMLGRYLTDKWQWGALLGFLYAFSPQYFSFIYGGHEGKMMVFGVAPFAMYSLLRLLRESSLKHLIYLSLSLIWMLTSAHLQIAYFFLWGAGLFVIFELFSNRLSARVRCIRLGLASLALAIALMICAFQIIPPYFYTSKESVRGTEEKTTIEHSASWSLHSEELAAIILPGFLGLDVHKEQPNQNSNVYWGQNRFKLNSDTCGALLTFLALCGCLLPGNRRSALFWIFGCIIALSYAMGLHSFLFAFWYNLIPGVKNFRAPSMSMHWLPLAFIFLAAPVLKNFEENKKIIKQGAILYGILSAGILFFRYAWESLNGAPVAIFIILFGAYFIKIQNFQQKLNAVLWFLPFIILASFFLNSVSGSYFKPVDFATAANLFSHSLTSFAIIVAVLASAFFVFLNTSMSITQKALILAAVAAVDLAIINFPFIQNVPGIQYYNPNHPIIQAIKKDSPNDMERSRVYSLASQPSINENIFPAYNMRNALGYHDNEIANYRIFREELQNPATIQVMLDLMNVGYVIFDRLIINPGDLGRAKMYYRWESENSGEEIIKRLKDSDFDYRNILLLENSPLVEGWQAQPYGDSEQGNVKIISAKMDNIIFEVESSDAGKLFISENYHKYWKAKVNGENVDTHRAFSTFMAVDIARGKSVVELSYVSDSVRVSLWIGAAGLILLLGVAVCNVLRFLPKP